jgi:hypothetical protein
MKSQNKQVKNQKDYLAIDINEISSLSSLTTPFLTDLIDPMLSSVNEDFNNNNDRTISEIEPENNLVPKFENIIEIDTKIRKNKDSKFVDKKFKCNWIDCPKEYRSKENLTLHLKNVHLKIKPYKCRFCLLKFSHRNGKTYHERKFHINNLPYKCIKEGIFNYYIGCELAYPTKSSLNAHIKSKH